MARRRRMTFSVATLFLLPLLSWLLLFSCSLAVQAANAGKKSDSSVSSSSSSTSSISNVNRTSPSPLKAEARDDDHHHDDHHDHHHDHDDDHHHHHHHRHHHHRHHKSGRPSSAVRKWFNSLLANRDKNRDKDKQSSSSTPSSSGNSNSNNSSHQNSYYPSQSPYSSVVSNHYGLVPISPPSSGTTSAAGSLYGPYSNYAATPPGTPTYMTTYSTSPYASMAGGGLSGSSEVSNGPTATIVPLSMNSPYTIMASPMPSVTQTSKASQMAMAAAAAVYNGGSSQPLYLASPHALTTYGYDASGFAYAIPVPVVPTYVKSYDHSSSDNHGGGGTRSIGRYKSRKRLKSSSSGFDDSDRSPAHLAETILDSDGNGDNGSLETRTQEHTSYEPGGIVGSSFDPSSDQLEPFADSEAEYASSSSTSSGSIDGDPVSAEEFGDGGEEMVLGRGRSKL